MQKEFSVVGSLGFVRAAGITLVETMVSITLGLFILAGVFQLYATSTQNATVVDASAVVQENARYVFSRLEQDISQAGYMGCFSAAIAQNRFAVLFDTDVSAGDFYDFSSPMVGKKGTTESEEESEEESESTSGVEEYDSIVLRYLSVKHRQQVTAFDGNYTFTVADSSKFKQGEVAAIGDCSGIAIFKVSNEPSSGAVAFGSDSDDSDSEGESTTYNSSTDLGFAPKATLAQRINSATMGAVGIPRVYIYGGTTGAFRYHVATSAAGEAAGEECSDTNPQYCALFRSDSSTAKGDELVEGVETLKFTYGWQDPASGELRYADANGVTDWVLVDRVKVALTLNSVSRASTEKGPERITRSYSRTILVQNQVPADNQALTLNPGTSS